MLFVSIADFCIARLENPHDDYTGQFNRYSYNNIYFTRDKNLMRLRNKKVAVTYDYKKKSLNVLNLLKIEQSFYMDSSNIFRPIAIFGIIASYFDINTTFDALLAGFKTQGINIVESSAAIKDYILKNQSYEQKSLLIPIMNITLKKLKIILM